MESREDYFTRKYRELSLLNDCLLTPLTLSRTLSIEQIIAEKFRLAALVKAERIVKNWALTETAWKRSRSFKSGAFAFEYGYQRADMSISGPPIYKALATRQRSTAPRTIYAGSGMSALAVLFSAVRSLRGGADVVTICGGYGETLELIDSYGPQFRRIRVREQRTHNRTDVSRILLIDSSIRESFFDHEWLDPSGFDLALFDSTCFWRHSGRINRVIAWAERTATPLVVVRSHAKLDALGIEYGRLGSMVFVLPDETLISERIRWTSALPSAVEDALRLSGAAPIPAHFAPFVGLPEYERLSKQRTAAILKNNRRMRRALAPALASSAKSLSFQHGLYIALAPHRPLSLDDAKDVATELSAVLEGLSLPIRHAGSFGFDFFAIDWFREADASTHVIRIAAPDLPTASIDDASACIAAWWTGRFQTQSVARRKAAAPSDA